MSSARGTPFWDRVKKTNTCWIWLAARNSKGYGHVWNDGQLVQSHRLAWEMTNGPIPSGMLVCHRCDNPPCVRPDHLFLGTVKDNAIDMVEKGRGRYGHWQGQDHPRAILNNEKVLAIRAMEGTMSRPKIAALFGVAAITVTKIHRRALWRHL